MSLWPFKRPGEQGLERLRERYARTLDPAFLQAEMRRAISRGQMENIPLGTVETRPLAIKKDRFIVLVDVSGPPGAHHELVAKGYWDDRAHRVFQNHRMLWDNGLGDPSAFVRTSRPWGVVPTLGVIITERLGGTHPSLGDAGAAERAARAAALLHRCKTSLQPRFDLAAALANLERHVTLLGRREPELANRSAGALAAAGKLGGTVGVRRDDAVNGDLSVGSFLLHGDHTYLIDWDVSCSFDAAWDVAGYLVQLRRFGLEQGIDTAATRKRFLGTYVELGVHDSFLTRVAYFEGMVCLHKVYTVSRLKRPRWRDVASHLTDWADRRFGELV